MSTDDTDGPSTSRSYEVDTETSPTEYGPHALPRHRSWLHVLFWRDGYYHSIAVAGIVSASFFVGVYMLSMAWGLDAEYLDPSIHLGRSAYFTCLGIFVELVILSQWVNDYTTIMLDIESCFTTDELSYEEFLDARLERLYDVRPLLVLFVLFEPIHIYIANRLTPFESRGIVLILLNVVLVYLAITAIYMAYVHFGTVKRVLRLGFENIYTAARDLKPLVRFSITISFWWFVGVSLMTIYYWLWLSDELQALNVSGTSSTESIFVVENAVLFGLLITIGFAVVAVPTWQMHVALADAKEDLLAEVNAKRNEIHNEVITNWTTTGSPGEFTAELSAAEQAYESVAQIRTWPYDVKALSKVLISAVLPMTQFGLSAVSTVGISLMFG